MKKLVWVFVSVGFLFLSSCITIFESYKFNRDGSGSMEYLIDLSELQSLMEVFSDSLVINDLNFGESFEIAVPELNGMKGISNAYLAGNPAKFLFGIGFEFE
ncbi:MAG: hypothetical protein ACP5E3_02700, partial [Bacteroidales bacterium]